MSVYARVYAAVYYILKNFRKNLKKGIDISLPLWYTVFTSVWGFFLVRAYGTGVHNPKL